MYKSPLLTGQPGLVHAYSGVGEGNMDYRFGSHEEVLSNRTKFLEGLGLDIAVAVQQNGLEDGIHVVSLHDAGRGMNDIQTRIHANAFITDEVGVPLFLCIADCLPVILYDSTHKVIALAHAARNSTNLKLVARVVACMTKDYNTSPKELLVAFGPGIRSQSYIFDEHIHELVDEAAWGDYIKALPNGTFSVDVPGYNKQQLVDAGVPIENIDDSEVDTVSDPGYFSHVRSKQAGDREGRLAAVVALAG